MRFREGMLGITVVMVAISMGLLGGWVLSTDVNDVETTIYNELTEITPLFGSENAPQYTTYNPSSNYTGYYTDSSTIDGQKYFDGVDYTSSSRANTYRLNLAPVSSDTGTASLSGVDYETGYSARYYDKDSNGDLYFKFIGVHDAYLSEILTLIGTEGWDVITIASEENLVDFTNTAGQDVSFDGILFTSSADWVANSTNGHIFFGGSPTTTGETVNPNLADYPGPYTLTRPAVAISVDLRTNTATLFYDYQMQERASIVSIDDVIVTYGTWSAPSTQNGIKQIDLLDSIDYKKYVLPLPTYLDPSKGVEME